MKKFLQFISNGSEMLEISPFVDIFGWNKIVGDKKEKIEIIRTKEQNAAWRIAHRALRMRYSPPRRPAPPPPPPV